MPATPREEEHQHFNPFPGLRPFTEEEDYLFFGREAQSNALLRRLRQTRFLAVVGTSGSGKSSLVLAGLLPALYGGVMTQAGSSWRVATLRPGNNPIGALAQALCQPDVFGPPEEDESQARDTMPQAIITETTLRRSALGLGQVVQQARLAAGENLLVVVDQFEEIFRFKALAQGTHGADDCAAFVKLLLEASRAPDSPIYVVLTMRSDFLGDCAQFRDLPEAINNGQFLIPRMTRDQRRQAIEGPVAVGGATMTPRLGQRLLNDVGDNPDQLPILQHALMRTWHNWQHDHTRQDAALDLPHYEAIGGMALALSQHGDEVYHSLPDDHSRAIAAKLFKALTDKGLDNRGIRRPTRLHDLCAISSATHAEVTVVLEAFRQPSCSFLVPAAHVPLTADSVIDISHESLMRVWKRLNDWVEEEAHSTQMYRRLAETAALYQTGHAGLWHDPDLQLALDWQAENRPTEAWAVRHHPGFTTAMRFLHKSSKAREADRQKEEAERQHELAQARLIAEERAQRLSAQEKSATRLRRMLVSLAGVLVIALGAAAVAIRQTNIATEKTRMSAALMMAAGTYKHLHNNLDLALLLSLEAFKTEKSTKTREAVLTGLTTAPHLLSFLHGPYGHRERVRSVAFSPDGQTLASAGDDTTIILWDVATRAPRGEPLRGHHEPVLSLAFSPDGQTLASASDETSIIVWDVATHAPRGEPLRGHHEPVLSLAFSPDGRTLASSSADNTIILWDVATHTPHGQPLSGHQERVWNVAFSPDGKTLASGSDDNTIIVWDVATHIPRGDPLTRHQGPVIDVAFSPDGKTLASSSADNSIILWDVMSRTPQGAPIIAYQGLVLSVAFSPDGQTLAAGSDANTIMLWDIATHTPRGAPLTGHAGTIASVAFSPDGTTLASGSWDNTIILWDTASQTSLSPLIGHAGSIASVAFSPDGTTLASASADNTILFWNVSTRTVQGEPLLGHAGTVTSVAFSPDGQTLASGGDDNTIMVWDVAARSRQGEPLVGHQDTVTSVTFSPDGQTLASSSADNTILVWDVSTSAPRGEPLLGHQGTVWSVAFSPDGQTLASASADNTIRLWDVATQKRHEPALTGHQGSVVSLAFSPNGASIASGSADNTIIVWDVATHTLRRKLTGHKGLVESVAFSPDGKTLASGSDANTIILWDIDSGTILSPLTGHAGTVKSVAFSPDGQTLASGSADHTIILWDGAFLWNGNFAIWQEHACQRANRNLSCEEWKQNMEAAPYQKTCPALPAYTCTESDATQD